MVCFGKVFFIVFVLKTVNCDFLGDSNTFTNLKDEILEKMQNTFMQQFGTMFRVDTIFGGSGKFDEPRAINDRYDDTKCYLQTMAMMKALNNTEMWAIKGIFFFLQFLTDNFL